MLGLKLNHVSKRGHWGYVFCALTDWHMKQDQGMDKLLHPYFSRNWSLTHAQISQTMKFVSDYIPYSYVDVITYTYP